MPVDDEVQAPASADPARTQRRATPEPVDTGPDGELLWDTLRETWLTQRVVAHEDTHVKGAYAWDASRYLPVFLTDEDGDPRLAFARE